MSREQELEQEGEIAADFIEEFLDTADLDGDLEIEFRQDRVYISVTSEGESNLGKISDPNTVERTIAKLEETDKPQHLKPMSSYDRKLVHDMVSEAGFVSESEGQGKDRHIVVSKP